MPQKRPVGKMVVKTGIVGGPSRVTTAEATTRAHRPLLRTRTAVVTATSTAGRHLPFATIAVATVRRLRPEGTMIAAPRATAAQAALTTAADTIATPRTIALVVVAADTVVVAARGISVTCQSLAVVECWHAVGAMQRNITD